MQIHTSLRIQPHDIVAFAGAGGKTSAMFRLADELVAQGKRVIITTTTRLGAAQIIEPCLRYEPTPDFVIRVRDALNQNLRVLLVGED